MKIADFLNTNYDLKNLEKWAKKEKLSFWKE